MKGWRVLFARLTADPIGFLGRAWSKLVTGPARYRQGTGYDSARFWRDRFTRLGGTLRAAGDEGLDPAANAAAYARAADQVRRAVVRSGLVLAESRVLEIGPGAGFYADLIAAAGVRHYSALDITDALFSDLRARHPSFRFLRQDITETTIDGTYDLVLMIDVLEHIVEPARCGRALDHLARSVRPGGHLLLAFPPEGSGRVNLFYLHFWPRAQVLSHFPGWAQVTDEPFRDGLLLGLRAPTEA